MKNSKIGILVIAIVTSFIACNPKVKENVVKQSYTSHTPTAYHTTALEVLKASKEWIQNFNKGNGEACVSGYTENAVMSAMPFGLKKGKKEIANFWIPFLESGANNLVYTNVKVEVANENTAFLSANWSMNVGRGIIFQEKWEKKDGVWKLTYDDFQVLEQFKTPQENKTNPIGSHLVLEQVIKTSIKWIDGFNAGESTLCGNGYSEDAQMNAIPFASINGQKGIEGFWKKLITDGANNLTYHKPIFEATTDHSVLIASQWSMNIGEGQIYQEKWERINNKWLLSYDEFEVLKKY